MKQLRITVDGKAYDVTVEVLGETASPAPSPRPAETAPSQAPAASAPAVESASGSGVIPSPMAGTVFKVKVQPGDSVKAGEPLIILEAMKMETPVAAAADAVVREILVKEGDAVQENQPLLRLE